MGRQFGSCERFELRRQSDDLVYTFVREQFDEGNVAYKRCSAHCGHRRFW